MSDSSLKRRSSPLRTPKVCHNDGCSDDGLSYSDSSEDESHNGEASREHESFKNSL